MHILLIARHYPPEISGGARRPFLLNRALRDAGHTVTLVTPFEIADDPQSIYIKHPVAHINALIEVSNQQSTSPQEKESQGTPENRLAKINNAIRKWFRVWMLWPDPEIRWARTVVKTLSAKSIDPDWIMTTSPPESLHLAGAKLARKFNIPWVAEFRDTWILFPHRAILETSRIRSTIEKFVARKALKNVTAITSVSEAVMAEIREYAPPETPECMIGHFGKNASKATNLDPSTVNFVHTGGFSLSDRRRTLEPLLKVFAKTAQNRPDLHLHLAGQLSESEKAVVKSFNSFKITLYGRISLEASLALQEGADGLVLYTPPHSHALPGKYAEYCFARRPILYFGGGDWINLVEDFETLLKLEDVLPNFGKGEKTLSLSLSSADTAAETLVSFLQSVSENSK